MKMIFALCFLMSSSAFAGNLVIKCLKFPDQVLIEIRPNTVAVNLTLGDFDLDLRAEPANQTSLVLKEVLAENGQVAYSSKRAQVSFPKDWLNTSENEFSGEDLTVVLDGDSISFRNCITWTR